MSLFYEGCPCRELYLRATKSLARNQGLTLGRYSQEAGLKNGRPFYRKNTPYEVFYLHFALNGNLFLFGTVLQFFDYCWLQKQFLDLLLQPPPPPSPIQYKTFLNLLLPFYRKNTPNKVFYLQFLLYFADCSNSIFSVDKSHTTLSSMQCINCFEVCWLDNQTWLNLT